MINPITPLVTLAMRIEINEFTAVFPSNSVHSNKFPFLRTGMMVLACSLLSGSPPLGDDLQADGIERHQTEGETAE